ncbi:MAG: DedA family protein [Myxococcota bacterium]
MPDLPSLREPAALLLACLGSGLVVPLPEDVALLVAGWRTREGSIGVGEALLFGTVGTLGRDAIAFGLGRLVGPRVEGRVQRWFGAARLARAHALFQRHGTRMLFLTRFLVGVRAPLYFVGGSLGFPARRFLQLDLLGLAITVPLTLWLGATFGESAAHWLAAVIAHQRIALSVLVGLVLLSLLLRRRREA